MDPNVGTLEHAGSLDTRQFVVAVRRLADSLTYGTDHSAYLGAGIEYVQSRPYEPGDPVRSIDWRVTARLRRVHVKEYEAPRSLPCHVVLDTSASMTLGSKRTTKYATAVFLAGGIALACLDRVSPVGLIAVGERKLKVQPTLSKPRLLQWVLELRRFRRDEATTLAQRVREVLPSLHERGLFVVISDLHDQEALASLKLASARHDVLVLHLQDRAELGLRGAGILRAREAETGHEFLVTGRQSLSSEELVRESLRRAGIDHLLIRPEENFVPALRQLLRFRGAVGRGAR